MLGLPFRLSSPPHKVQSLPMKSLARSRRRVCSTMGWRPSSIVKTSAVVDFRAYVALLYRELREPRIVIELS